MNKLCATITFVFIVFMAAMAQANIKDDPCQLIASGDLRIENVYDSSMSSYSETTSGMGGLEGSVFGNGDIAYNIKNDLRLEAVRNNTSSTSSNETTSASVSVGSNGVSANANHSESSNSSSDSQYVNSTTNVDGKLSLTGSAIVNAELDDNDTIIKDLGNLNISAGSFEYEDLTDYSENSQTGFSVVGGGSSTTLGATNTGSETDGKTYATIGNGTVTIKDGSAIDYLNRDVTLMQETTKYLVTGALDGSMTVDNRWFSEEGQQSILNDFDNLTQNLGQIGKGLTNNVISQSIKNAVTDNQTNIFEAVQDYVRDDKLVKETLDKYAKFINGATNFTDEEVKDLLQAVVDIASKDGGFTGAVSISNVEGNVIGVSYTDANGNNQSINLNLENVDLTDPNALINAVFHETTNKDRHGTNEKTAQNRGDTADAILALKNYGNENLNEKDGLATWMDKYGNGNVIKD